MQQTCLSRDRALTRKGKVTFALPHVRVLALAYPELLPEASDWAKRFHPATSLARAA